MINKVYVLLADTDGTMRSQDEPFGVAVTSENEAKKFVSDCNFGYTRSYKELIVFDDYKKSVDYYIDQFVQPIFKKEIR